MKIISEEMKNIINDYSKYLELLGKSGKTIDSYTGFLSKFLRDNDIDTLDKFVELDNEFWLDYIARKKESISVATINKQIKQCSSFYQYLIVGRGYVTLTNYCRLIPKVSNKSEYKENPITEEQAKALVNLKWTKIDATHNKYSNLRNRTFINLLFSTALRIEEVTRIELQDIDLSNRRLAVRGKGFNGKISRYANFNNQVRDLIEELIAFNPDRKYLFENYMGKQMSTQSLRAIFYQALEMVGISKDSGIHPHSVRHFTGSKLVESGVPMDKVRKVLGHSKLSKTCEKFYIRDNKEEDLNEITSVIDIF